jgi:hypothetical protein
VPKEGGWLRMSKRKRIRSKRKHDQEIMRHIIHGDIGKALKTISKDPSDNILKFTKRKLLPLMEKKLSK